MTLTRFWKATHLVYVTLKSLAVELVKGLSELTSFAPVDKEFVFIKNCSVSPSFRWVAMKLRFDLPFRASYYTVHGVAFH